MFSVSVDLYGYISIRVYLAEHKLSRITTILARHSLLHFIGCIAETTHARWPVVVCTRVNMCMYVLSSYMYIYMYDCAYSFAHFLWRVDMCMG